MIENGLKTPTSPAVFSCVPAYVERLSRSSHAYSHFKSNDRQSNIVVDYNFRYIHLMLGDVAGEC